MQVVNLWFWPAKPESADQAPCREKCDKRDEQPPQRCLWKAIKHDAERPDNPKQLNHQHFTREIAK
jgi:hypothetical protein